METAPLEQKQVKAIEPVIAKAVVKPVIVEKQETTVALAENHTEYEGLKQGDTFGELVPFGDPYWYQDWVSLSSNDSLKVFTLLQREPSSFKSCY